jgi:hypothetical protein
MGLPEQYHRTYFPEIKIFIEQEADPASLNKNPATTKKRR